MPMIGYAMQSLVRRFKAVLSGFIVCQCMIQWSTIFDALERPYKRLPNRQSTANYRFYSTIFSIVQFGRPIRQSENLIQPIFVLSNCIKFVSQNLHYLLHDRLVCGICHTDRISYSDFTGVMAHLHFFW